MVLILHLPLLNIAVQFGSQPEHPPATEATEPHVGVSRVKGFRRNEED